MRNSMKLFATGLALAVSAALATPASAALNPQHDSYPSVGAYDGLVNNLTILDNKLDFFDSIGAGTVPEVAAVFDDSAGTTTAIDVSPKKAAGEI